MKTLKSGFITLLFAITFICATLTGVAGSSFNDTSFNVTMIACSAYQNFILLENGTIWSWGTRVTGDVNGLLPHVIPGPGNITMIATDNNQVYMLKDDGTVWCQYEYDADGGMHLAPTGTIMIPGLTDVIAISGKDNNFMALRRNGEVWTIGNNFYGELGNKTSYDPSNPPNTSLVLTPVKADIAGAKAIVSGGQFSWAIKNDGTIWGWGSDYFGQLGDGKATAQGIIGRYNPLRSDFFNDVISIGCGGSYTVVLRKDGTVWSWGGNNHKGQHGDGSNMNEMTRLYLYPVQVKNIENVISIASGGYHVIALKDNGTVWAWGENSRGQLGDGTTENRNLPVRVRDLDHIVAISAYSSQSMALDDQGNVWTWGSGNSGQLGDGISSYDHYSTIPVRVIINNNSVNTTGNTIAAPTNITPTANPTNSGASSPGMSLGIALTAISMVIGVYVIIDTRRKKK